MKDVAYKHDKTKSANRKSSATKTEPSDFARSIAECFSEKSFCSIKTSNSPAPGASELSTPHVHNPEVDHQPA
eukprot:2610478-Rhodomonas_salina.1